MKNLERTASRPRHRLTHLLALAALVSAWLPSVQAQEVLTPVTAEKIAPPSPAYARWQNSLAAFAKADQAQYPVSDGVVFVGSSTIRMWNRLAQDFSPLPILNRGFGGSTLADCNALAQELVIQYKPRQVILYAGDNDLAEGRSPADVLASFASFVQRVRAELPGSRIDFISIKPSPSRLSLMPRIREANALIQAHAQTLADVRYIDVFSPMLDAQGQPRPELFLGDRLHLNAAGYQLWQSVVGAYLAAAPAPPPGQAQVANREAVSASATPMPLRKAP